MSFRARFINLGVAIALANALVLAPVTQVYAQDKIQGESTIYDLSILVKGDLIKQSTEQFKLAVSELKNAAGHAKAIVLDAKEAFKENPCRRTEAELVRANAEALTCQFQAMAQYRLAAQSQGNAIDAVLGELRDGKKALGVDIEEIKRDGVASSAKAAKVEIQLKDMAANIDSLVGPDGELDPALTDAVRHLDWTRNQALQASKDAATVQRKAEDHLQDVDVLMGSLRKAKGNLKHSADATVLLQASLSKIADYQSKQLGWRGLRDRTEAVVNAVPGDLTGFLPVVKFSDLPGLPGRTSKGKIQQVGNGGKEARDILKKYLVVEKKQGKEAEKKSTVKKA